MQGCWCSKQHLCELVKAPLPQGDAPLSCTQLAEQDMGWISVPTFLGEFPFVYGGPGNKGLPSVMWLPQRPLGGLDNNSHNNIFSVSLKCKWFHPLKNHEALESSWESRGDSQWTNNFSFYIKSAWQRLLVRWDGGVFNGFCHCSGYVVSELSRLYILSVQNIGACTPKTGLFMYL